MCGVYYLSDETVSYIERIANITESGAGKMRWSLDIHPSMHAPVIRGSDRKLDIALARWGFPGM